MEPYPHIFYDTRWSGYFMLVLGLVFLLAAAFSLASQRVNELAGLLFLAFAALCSWFGWKTIVDIRPVLQFGRNGIWTRKLGDTEWQAVLLEFTHVTSGKAGSFDFLRITDRSTARHLDSIVISGLDKPIDDVKALLKNFKNAQFRNKRGH